MGGWSGATKRDGGSPNREAMIAQARYGCSAACANVVEKRLPKTEVVAKLAQYGQAGLNQHQL
jgi:hypothetical protein